VICQIVYAKLQGDVVLTQATSKELPRYGINHGLTNWTAAYATGLLVARRALTKLGLADKYEGVVEPSGELELIEPREWFWRRLLGSGYPLCFEPRADAPCQSARTSPARSRLTSMSVSAAPRPVTVCSVP
jgi:hypothetical protein